MDALDQAGADPNASLDDQTGWTWKSWQVILLMMNATLGIILFEWAFFKSRRFRQPIEELENIYPAYKRRDRGRWSRWKFYPGAMTVLIPRFLFGCIIALICILLVKLALIGHPANQPLGGCRKPFIRWCYKVFTFLFQLITNFNVVTFNKLTLDDVDHYQEWLGPKEQQTVENDLTAQMPLGIRHFNADSTDYSDKDGGNNLDGRKSRIPSRGPGPASTVICNHTGWFDVMALIQSPLHPGFTPKAHIASMPLLGTLTKGLQSLFIHRGANAAEKEIIIDQIMERQRLIEEEEAGYNPICIFPEMTTTNGRALLKFKRGAFMSLRTVTPVFVQVGDTYMDPTYDVVDFQPHIIMFLSSFGIHNMKVNIMPDFTPTEWMLNEHRDKSEHDWEIFADCVREAMAKHGRFLLEDRPVREKLRYEDFMCGRSDTVEVDGQTYVWPAEKKNADYNRVRESKKQTGDEIELLNGPRLLEQ